MKVGDVEVEMCNLGTYVLYFMRMELTDDEQMRLIRQLSQWYSDTDQDEELYAEELCNFVIGITEGMLLLNPKYLLLEEILDAFLCLIPKADREDYKKVFKCLDEGHQLAECHGY